MEKLKEIVMPVPWTSGKVSLEEAIARRRSCRRFFPRELTAEQISQLLWSAAGITESKKGHRAAPSAGATYPIEIYLLTGKGLFHYVPDGHKLLVVGETDLRSELSQACHDQAFVAQTPASLVITCIYNRTTGRYGERGIRYVHIEAGHIAENVHLQAVALGLGSVPVGAFDDDWVKKVLGLPRQEEPLYVIPVGYVAEKK